MSTNIFNTNNAHFFHRYFKYSSITFKMFLRFIFVVSSGGLNTKITFTMYIFYAAVLIKHTFIIKKYNNTHIVRYLYMSTYPFEHDTINSGLELLI